MNLADLKLDLSNRCHYGRFRYLGDAVLQYIVSQFLFDKEPLADEGKLTVNILKPH